MSANLQLIAKPDALALTPHQQEAFGQLKRFALGETPYKMAVLSGYAGTGKTTLVGELARACVGRVAMAMAAPTHKAVKVLREKMKGIGEMEFASIHSLLGLRMVERDDGTMDCRPEGEPSLDEYSLVVVDECSMISRELFSRIMTSKGACRVLFVGDPAQLPPVGDAAHSPVFDQVEMHLQLTEVVRQARDNPIIQMSMALREAMQQNRAVSAGQIADNLPPMGIGVSACVTTGGEQTLTSWALAELVDGRDARIIAFTNHRVKEFNRRIHEALHGYTQCPFSPGEAVLVHEQCEVRHTDGLPQPVLLHTNEELLVEEVRPHQHPRYPDLACHQLVMRRDDGERVTALVADNPDQLHARISALFDAWRSMTAKANKLEGAARVDARMEAKECSDRAWGLKKAFAPLRHTYAITAHKSQGSTFDTALVDYADISRMRSPFEMNRALYVAITRPRDFLAVVV